MAEEEIEWPWNPPVKRGRLLDTAEPVLDLAGVPPNPAMPAASSSSAAAAQAPVTKSIAFTAEEQAAMMESLSKSVAFVETANLSREDDAAWICEQVWRHHDVPIDFFSTWQFSWKFLLLMESSWQATERWYMARNDAESESLRKQLLGDEALEESWERDWLAKQDYRWEASTPPPAKHSGAMPTKFEPDPTSYAQMQLRHLKDKHNEREAKRRARRFAELEATTTAAIAFADRAAASLASEAASSTSWMPPCAKPVGVPPLPRRPSPPAVPPLWWRPAAVSPGSVSASPKRPSQPSEPPPPWLRPAA